MAVDAQIAHSERRVAESKRLAERVEKDLARQTRTLEELQQAAKDVEREMDRASGKHLVESDVYVTYLQNNSVKGVLPLVKRYLERTWTNIADCG